jgi:SSS family solute:Na+ symporter
MGSAALRRFWPALPFMDRVGLAFVACLALAIVLSLLQPWRESALRLDLEQVDYSTNTGFNRGALAVVAIVIALWATWW